MNGYQIWSEQPELWALNFAVSLAFTILLYGAFPIVFARVRKGEITKGRYRGYCIAAAVTGYVFLMVLYAATEEEGVPNMVPAVLWTGVFYKIGLSSLEKRGKLAASVPENPVKTWEPVSHGQGAAAARRDIQSPKPPAAVRQGERPGDAPTAVRLDAGGAPVRFCRHCGGALVPNSRFCSICGTKVVREW